MRCNASTKTNIGFCFGVSSILWASSVLLICSTLAFAQGISPTPSGFDPVLEARVNPLCEARQVTISPSGLSVAVVGVEEVGPSKSALFSMPSYGVMAWPEDGTIALQNTNSAPSLVRLAFVDDNSLLATTSFGASSTFRKRVSGEWAIDRTRSDQSVKPQEFVYRPANLFLYLPFDREFGRGAIGLDGAYNNLTMMGPKEFRSQREYTGLVSRTIIGPHVLDLGSRDDGNLVWRSNLSTSVTSLDGYHRMPYSNLQFARLNAGGYALVSRGLFWPNPSNSNGPATNLPLYSAPIIDPQSGTLEFLAAPTSIVGLNNSPMKFTRRLNREVTAWTDRGWYLHTMTFSKATGKAVLLFRNRSDLRGKTTLDESGIVFIKSSSREIARFVCSNTGTVTPVPRLDDEQEGVNTPRDLALPVADTLRWFRLSSEVRHVGTPPTTELINSQYDWLYNTNRISVWVSQQRRRALGTVLLFRGGPSESLFDRPVSAIESLILQQGFRLVMLEYSGATETGADIGYRLGRNRNKSINDDAETIKALINAKRWKTDGPLFVVTESFGAGIGTVLSSKLTADLNAVVHLSGAGRWFDASLSPREGQTRIGQAGQVLSDRLSYGAPKDLADNQVTDWYQLIRRTACSDTRSTFVFGANDSVLSASDWLPECASHKAWNVLPNANHQIQNDARAVEIVRRIISSESNSISTTHQLTPP
jgi:hypothetical protein